MNTTFIISSVIHFSGKELPYAATRSVFTVKERIDQTVQTIASIKASVPDARIVFVEMGASNEAAATFAPLVDSYAHVGDRMLVRICVNGPFKGLGEAIGLLAARRAIAGIPTDLYIKISGRYRLTDAFSSAAFSQKNFSFLQRENTFSTRLFAFPQKRFAQWVRMLVFSVPLLLCGISIERALYMLIRPSRVTLLKRLGIAGTIAPTGEHIDE